MADKRLFFALWPSDRQREQLRDIVNPAMSGLEGSRVDRRNWHVTLVFLGDFAEERIPGLLTEVVAIERPEVRLRFDRISFWQRPRVAVLQAMTIPPALAQWVDSLETALLPFGFTPQERTYRPHITLSRKVRAFSEVRLARPIELQWSDFELVESRSVRGEIQYAPLART